MTTTASSSSRNRPLPPEAQGRIGQKLRQVYGEMLSEPMPDKFSKLLEKLAKSERDE
ncbi:MAG: NepR family anti-sigma factor [Hyphomicrobiaceae bacterium]